MKQRWIALALFLVTTLSVLTGWNWHSLRSQPQAITTSFQSPQGDRPNPSQSPIAESPRLVRPPQVDPNRLLSDVEALAFKRYTPAERAEARLYIMDALQAAGWSPQLQEFATGGNVVAERPGTDPAAGSILLAAHYDTVERSPGADDNASGVAAVLEAARLFQRQPTPRTLKLALFDLEEQGLGGSLAFAADSAKTSNLQAAVILEMLGYACYVSGCQHYPMGLPITPPTDQGDFLAVVGDQDHQPLIQAFQQAQQAEMPQVLSLAVPLLGLFTPDVLRSDHTPFWRKGIGAVMVTDTANFRTPHYHQPSDIPAQIDRPFFTGATQLVINALTSLLHSSDSLATPTSGPTVGIPGQASS